jgi:hypothetical protein
MRSLVTSANVLSRILDDPDLEVDTRTLEGWNRKEAALLRLLTFLRDDEGIKGVIYHPKCQKLLGIILTRAIDISLREYGDDVRCMANVVVRIYTRAETPAIYIVEVA